MRYILLFLVCLLTQSAWAQDRNGLEDAKAEALNRQFDSLEELLDNARASAAQIPGLHSLLVYRKGALLVEEYLHGYDGDRPVHVRSCTKSIISLLVGIAIEQGMIRSTDQPLSDYFQALRGTPRGAITIEHLLTMSSGLAWSEDAGGSEFNAWVTSSDPINYVLRKTLVNTPGEAFNYNSGTLHLLSVILTKATGMDTMDFARMYLFEPLGIKEVRWERIKGYYNGGAGLQLLPTDMVKVGQLMMNKGQFGMQQVVPQAWIERTVASHQTVFDDGIEHEGYGYGWWTLGYQDERAYSARGFGGQTIAVFPSLDLIVVTTAQWTNLKGLSALQSLGIYKLIVGDVAIPFFQQQF